MNHENVWANIQGYSIPSLGFDLEQENRWLPFIKPGVYEPMPPIPFYPVYRLGPKLPATRLAALRHQIKVALNRAYESWRRTRSMRWRPNARLEETLDRGLHFLETARCSSLPTDQVAVTCCAVPLHAVTYRYMPLHSIACYHMLSHAVAGQSGRR